MDISTLSTRFKGSRCFIFFIKLTQDDSLMTTINFLNEWALLLIGLRLDF